MEEENVVVEELTEEVTQEVTEETQETESPEAEGESDLAEAPKSDEFPKKAKNALAYHEKKAHKWKTRFDETNAINQELIKRLAAIETKVNVAEDNRPNPEDPKYKDKTYEDYLLDVVKWKESNDKLQSEKQDLESQNEKLQKSSSLDMMYEERAEELVDAAAQYAKVIPDYAQTMEANSDIMDSFPEATAELFLQSDNPTGALYVLAKEGKLTRIARMRPELVAAEIMRAEDRFNNLPKQQKTTSAPRPMQAAKGTGGAMSKPLHQWSTAELMERINKRK